LRQCLPIEEEIDKNTEGKNEKFSDLENEKGPIKPIIDEKRVR
jgi:hypothetical protein|tara:strand:+ start:8423 stop:8551 length:129 start_codon:yes stop_codon:yes gene_type:complete